MTPTVQHWDSERDGPLSEMASISEHTLGPKAAPSSGSSRRTKCEHFTDRR